MFKNVCIERPKQRRLVPAWNLGIVLKALQLSPFEPLDLISFKFFESLDLTPKAVSKYFNKVRTGHKFVGPELGNAGITITQNPFLITGF
jgi:hypothetical protein